MTTSLEWQFGGWLRALPASAAWCVLAGIAMAGCWLVFRSYRRAVEKLSPGARIALTGLRGGILILLLLCLANPTRVARSRPEGSRRELAVLVDRSASMSQPDRRGATRLSDAARQWTAHEVEAGKVFNAVNYYRFAEGFDRVGSFDDAIKTIEAGRETHLYAALQKALADYPAAIVCLTDGLDTTDEKAARLMNAATERGVPLYFVVGNNRSQPAGDQSLKIREVKIPARVLRQTHFTATALAEILSPTEGDVPMELWNGDTKIAATNQPVHEGLNSVMWPVELTAGEPAAMSLEFRLGTGAQQQVAGRTTHIVENTTVELLYYQGALQWGYRFLRGALDSDPSFRVTAILNPALGVRLAAGLEGQATLADLPEDARELKRFQIVVLAHAFADLLTPRQQQALLEYARGGGVVVSISPDTQATRRFSGTAIEQMLPVVFESSGASANNAESRFEQKMRAVGGTSPEEAELGNDGAARQNLPPLTPFVAATGATATRLFRNTGDMPRFSTYARVNAVKPGAEILAVHPTDRSRDGSPRVLVARQRFGEGFTAVVNTDLLWRWKLSLPSTNRAVSIFWQQFFLSLVPPIQGPALELTSRPESPQVNRPVTLHVSGTTEVTPTLTIRSPEGKQQRLALKPVSTQGTDMWETDFNPNVAGNWEANVIGAGGDAAKISIPVHAQVRTLELMNLRPDVNGLRRLAEATGGNLIDSGSQVFNQFAMEKPGEILRARPLWNNGWLAALLLAVYALELVMRRVFKLL